MGKCVTIVQKVTHFFSCIEIYKIPKIPYCSRDRFGTTVLLVHHMLTGAELSLEDLWRQNGEKVNKNHIHERKVGSVLFERMEFENSHNPYDQEVRELNSIRNGDLESFQKSIRETYAGSERRLSEKQIRQEKNIAICVITLASRAAIEGGVLPEMAFSMVGLQRTCYSIRNTRQKT